MNDLKEDRFDAKRGDLFVILRDLEIVQGIHLPFMKLKKGDHMMCLGQHPEESVRCFAMLTSQGVGRVGSFQRWRLLYKFVTSCT